MSVESGHPCENCGAPIYSIQLCEPCHSAQRKADLAELERWERRGEPEWCGQPSSGDVDGD